MNTLKVNLPSPEEAAIAKASGRALSGIIETKAASQPLLITDADGIARSVEIPVSALRFLVDVLTELGEGNTIKLVPVHAELTTQEGADLLNISRPTFIKLLDDGKIPFSTTGNRRKVKYVDVRAYQEKLETARLASLEALGALDQELGLGYK